MADGESACDAQVQWLGDQLVAKVMNATWMAGSKADWDRNCQRCDTLKSLQLLIMELEDDAVNW